MDDKRTDPKPDRRLGIKLEAPTPKRGLGGKLDAYVPPELRYDYKPPSVFAQYKMLTAVFVALAFILLGYGLWVAVSAPLDSRDAVGPAPAPQMSPAAGRPAPGTPAPGRPAPGRPAPQPQPPQDQPVYVEPLPAR